VFFLGGASSRLRTAGAMQLPLSGAGSLRLRMTSNPFERPTWVNESLTSCGFTKRGAAGPEAVSNVTQVHGARVHIVDSWAAPAEGDALWTAVSGVTVAVRVADCVPILLYDPHVPAVAAVHAGWRGTVAGIVDATLEEGKRALGVEPSRLYAAIGPAIGVCCFEVGPEVVEGLLELGLREEDFGKVMGPRGRPLIDLRGANKELLRRAGVPEENIELVGGCTFCHPRLYESYRRDGDRSGRMRGFIGLALMFFALFLPGCAPSEEAGTDIAITMGQATDALAGGDGLLSEELLHAVLKQRPEDPVAHAQLARALHLQGRDREAVVEGRIALGIDARLWQAAYNLACHSAALGDTDAAIRWLQEAILRGGLEREEVLADPDLLSLRDDHRFAFYESSGVLSRAEQDVLVLPDRREAFVGEPMTLSVLIVALNRPLMGERLSVELEFMGALSEGVILPIERSERFVMGESGGLEYSQRSLQFTFVPTAPGVLALGPFRVRQGQRTFYRSSPLLEFRERSGSEVAGERATAGDAEVFMSVGAFFQAPSSVDGELGLGLEPPAGRFETFRAPAADELPEGVKVDPEASFRSVFLQRGTEGLSHLLELR